MKEKICNQVIVGKQARCTACNETAESPEGWVKLKVFLKWMNLFAELHALKGCNDKKIINQETK